jgi:hypothetical protein
MFCRFLDRCRTVFTFKNRRAGIILIIMIIEIIVLFVIIYIIVIIVIIEVVFEGTR